MKIVFHDIDGCLNADANTPIPIGNERLSQNQLAKLKELGRKLDVSSIDHLVINTGRAMDETLSVVNGIASKKLQYVIAEHGAVYRDVINNKCIYPLGHMAEKLELIVSFISWYRETGAKILNERVGTEVPILGKAANLTLDARNGLDSQHIYDVLKTMVKSDAPFDYNQLIFHHSKPDGFVDVMGKIDKGNGIEVISSLISKLENPAETIRSIAIGNGMNDMSMLEVATVPVCPGNSEHEVRNFCRSRSGVVSEFEYIDATLHWLEEYT